MATPRCADCGKPLNTKPRFATKPTKGAKTWQRDIWRAAEDIGQPLMPWQRLGARLISELRPDGRPRFKTGVISVPRQSGKTTLSRASIHAVAQQRPYQELYGTSLTGKDAAKHVVKLGNELKRFAIPGIKVLRGQGAQSITWENESVYRPITPDEGGGHGDSIDWMLVDEAWRVQTHVMGGIRPAMSARPLSQLLAISTMGTLDPECEWWNGTVERGREAVDDPESMMFYVEYSAENDEDVFNEDLWHDWMPALGYTIDHEAIRTAIDDLMASPEKGRAEVIRAYGNRRVATSVTLFPEDWVEDAWRAVTPPQQFVLALDVNREPNGVSLAQGFVTEDGVASRVEWGYGDGEWLPDRLREAIQKFRVEAVVVDWGRPWPTELKAKVERICEDNHIALVNRQPSDLMRDTQSFYDALRERTVALERVEELETAIRGAVSKKLREGWLISGGAMSKLGRDASPLIATIMALGLAQELEIKPVVTEVAMAW